mgnify:CR=1 FL=1
MDANGDPIKCPPAYTTQTDPKTGKPVVVLLEGDEGKVATVTGDDGAVSLLTPPAYTPPAGQQIYVYYPQASSAGAGMGGAAPQWGALPWVELQSAGRRWGLALRRGRSLPASGRTGRAG